MHGRVFDDDGQPLANVDLTARRADRWFDAAMARSARDGRFCFEAVPLGLLEVIGYRDDRQLGFVEHVHDGRRGVTMKLARERQRTLRLVLRGATAEQLQHAYYWFRCGHRLPDTVYSQRPDADGVILVQGLPNAWSFASCTAHVPGMRTDDAFECPPREDSGVLELEFAFRPAPSVTIRGQVLRDDGSPLVGATLAHGSPVTQTDDRGCFEATVTPWNEHCHWLELRDCGHVLIAPPDDSFVTATWRTKPRVTLPPPLSVTWHAVRSAGARGQCLDASGMPRVDARVFVKGTTLLHDGTPFHSVLAEVHTDRDGRFEVSGLSPALDVPVFVESVGMRSEDIALRTGEVTDLPPLRAPRRATVTGTVHDLERHPLAWQMVELEYEGDDRQLLSASGWTNATGRFRITDAPPGRARLVACSIDVVTWRGPWFDVGLDGTTRVDAVVEVVRSTPPPDPFLF